MLTSPFFSQTWNALLTKFMAGFEKVLTYHLSNIPEYYLHLHGQHYHLFSYKDELLIILISSKY
jgi:hypothetical protein